MGIIISFELDSFKECISNFESDRTFYKTISEISVSDANKFPSTSNSCVFNNDILMISLDDVVKQCTSKKIPCLRKKCSKCSNKYNKCKADFQHKSVDALYVKFYKKDCHFFLFEFKNYNCADPAKISFHEIDKLSNYEDQMEKEDYNKIVKKLRNGEKISLKLKVYESIYSIIPNMYIIEYYKKNGKKYDNINELKSFLFNCKFSFYLVYNNYKRSDNYPNKSNTRKYQHESKDCKQDIFNIQRIKDFNLEYLDIITGSNEFESLYNELIKL
ncbi:MAG: hypothetical protein LBT66_09500 [Methanobrevibacter sp.]|jgi:hypothetical protein|nr:hypothetical protein [Candidatus Methanovirga meridionalis]